MKNLDKALENLKFDKRMTNWNMSNNVLTEEELKQHLANLQDLSAKAVEVTLESTDDDNDDDMSSF